MSQKILIIDDDPNFRMATASLLEANGYEVVTADNGKDGFEAAKTESPNLILLDAMMENQTAGFQAAFKLNEDPAVKDIPVIMVTGIANELNLSFSFNAAKEDGYPPVKRVIEKPVKPDELLKIVKEYIA